MVVRVVEAADPVAAFLAAHRADDLVALPTSGTAGRTRTVLRTTASWVDSFPTVSRLAGVGPGSRLWVPGPLSATMNLFAAVHARTVGARLVEHADEATHLQLTPTGLHRMLDEGACRSGQTAVVAGDGLAAPLRRQGEAAGLRVAHYYGAAELSFVAWGTDSTDLRPFPGVEVDVRDGVVWARSPFLAEGVEGEPGPFRLDGDGFASVGDRGLRQDGRLLVHGRDDAVVSAGVTVLLADVEAALRPALAGQVAVVGLPHPGLGAVVAAVLTDEGDRQAARSAAAGLGDARPRRWFVRERLPITPTGKVDRQALAEELAGR